LGPLTGSAVGSAGRRVLTVVTMTALAAARNRTLAAKRLFGSESATARTERGVGCGGDGHLTPMKKPSARALERGKTV
jgi:hypothetical protein